MYANMDKVKEAVKAIYDAAEYDEDKQEIIDVMNAVIRSTLYAGLFSGLNK